MPKTHILRSEYSLIVWCIPVDDFELTTDYLVFEAIALKENESGNVQNVDIFSLACLYVDGNQLQRVLVIAHEPLSKSGQEFTVVQLTLLLFLSGNTARKRSRQKWWQRF